jgi:UDP-N-acetylmuramoylalanine-D-glutamate ligase
MENISVIGLGSMGFGIAQSLIRSGYNVYGQDKNTVQQKKLIEEGGLDSEIPFGEQYFYLDHRHCSQSELETELCQNPSILDQ